MRHPRHDCDLRCPVEACVAVVGGTKRFNELARLMPAVAQRMPTRQLRELEADQAVVGSTRLDGE